MNPKEYSLSQYIRDVVRYVQPYNRQFVAGLFFRVTSDVARLIPVWAISQIVLELSSGSPREAVMRPLLIWGIAAAYFPWAHNFSKYLGFQVAEKASLDLYKEAISHIFRLDLSWQETENSGNKLKKIDKGLDGINVSIRTFFVTLVEAVVNVVGIVLIFIQEDLALTISLLGFIIVYFTIGTILLRKAVRQERVVNKKFENLGGLAFESVNNVQTIKALGIDTGILSAISSKVSDLVPAIKKRITYFQMQGGTLYTFQMAYVIAASAWIVSSILAGRYDVSVYVLFIGLYRRVESSTEELTEGIQMLSLAKIWVSRAMSILRIEPTIESPARMNGQKDYTANWEKLVIKNVGFAYKNRYILQNISLTIKRGEKVGIVGLSGAGKSTLFKLLLDLYENYEGTISLDNLSLKNIKRQSYIDHVSVVLQETELFDMTLRENIEIAGPSNLNTDATRLQEAITRAHLEEVVKELPKGIDTIIGEKGFKLSGGQRQRVGIARALYRQPDILLLDEATSHLDAHSEKEIQRAIEENIGEFTTIVIAHRLSTIKAMDKIVVLEKGRVVEVGSFTELLKRGRQFATMWQEQKI